MELERQIKPVHSNKTAADYSLMTEREIAALKEYCTGKTVIEIGSFKGASSKAIGQVAKRLLCIDKFEPLKWGDAIIPSTLVEFLDSIDGLDNVSYLKMSSDDAIEQIYRFEKHPTCDVVFIDGDHSFAQCLKDLQHYTVLKPTWVLVHDYSYMFGGVIAACQTHFQRLPDDLYDSLAVYSV